MNGVGLLLTTDAMVDALHCFTLMSPHTGHLHPAPRRLFRYVHYHDWDRAGSRGLLSPDRRDGRGLSFRPRGHPVPAVGPGGRGRHRVRGSARQRARLVAHVASGSRGGRCGDKVREAVFWDLDGVFVCVCGRELVDDPAAVV